MTALIAAIVLALVAQALIYAGLTFINANLLTGWLAPVYEVTTPWQRLLIHTLLAGVPASWLLPKVYDLIPPGTAGAAILATLVLVLAGKAVLLHGAAPDARTLIAIAATAVCAAWMAIELQRLTTL